MVQIWGNSLSCEDSQNFINDWWFEYVPKMLEESSMKTVHSWGFIRFQRGEGLENFRIQGHDGKLAGVLFRESNNPLYFKVCSGDGGQVLGLIELFISTKNNVHHLIFVLNPFPRLIHLLTWRASKSFKFFFFWKNKKIPNFFNSFYSSL